MEINVNLYFQISPTSGVPIYRQLFDQVKICIAMGKFTEGQFLPSIRDVAKSLEINPMTVSKAYSLLEKSGHLEFVRGQGMRVPASPQVSHGVVSPEDELAPLLREVVNRAQQMSLERERVIEKFNEFWKGDGHE
ncbi:MAG: GntR family transcriptional regulator [Candidatus Omnitrophota bacterium]